MMRLPCYITIMFKGKHNSMITIYKLFTFNRNFNKPLAYKNMSFPKDVFFIGRCKVGFFIESDFFLPFFLNLQGQAQVK